MNQTIYKSTQEQAADAVAAALAEGMDPEAVGVQTASGGVPPDLPLGYDGVGLFSKTICHLARPTSAMNKRVPPKPKKFPAAKQRWLDELLEKNSEGTIATAEKTRLKKLVAEAEQLMVTNAKRLAEFSKSDPVDAPAGAVPVTVWVKPEHAES